MTLQVIVLHLLIKEENVMKQKIAIMTLSIILLFFTAYSTASAKVSLGKTGGSSVKSSSINSGKVSSVKSKTNTKTNAKTSPSNIKSKNAAATATKGKNKYKGQAYYKGNNFSKTLLTAAGVYLILDSVTNEGDPIYVSAETGEPVKVEELKDVKPVEDTEPITEEEKEEASKKVNSYYELIRQGNYGTAIKELLLSKPEIESQLVPEDKRNTSDIQQVIKQISQFYTSKGNSVATFSIEDAKEIDGRSILFTASLTDSKKYTYQERIVAIKFENQWYLTFDLVDDAVNQVIDEHDLTPREVVTKYYKEVINANYGAASTLVSKNQSFTKGKTDEEIKTEMIEAFSENENPLSSIDILKEKKENDQMYSFTVNLTHLYPGFFEDYIEKTTEVEIKALYEGGMWKLNFDDEKKASSKNESPFLSLDDLKILLHIVFIGALCISIAIMLSNGLKDRKKLKMTIIKGRR